MAARTPLSTAACLILFAAGAQAAEGGLRAPPGSEGPQVPTAAEAPVADGSGEKCASGAAALVADAAPGCLDACKPAVCGAVGDALNAYMNSSNVDRVTRSICANPAPLECLLELENVDRCRPLFDVTRQLGVTLPESKAQLDSECSQFFPSSVDESAEDAAPPAQPAPQAAVTAQASLDKCTLGFVPLLAGQAPGCLDPCKPAVCDAVTNAINAYMAHKNVDDVKRSVCANRSPFECLLEPANIGSCRPLFTKAQQYGFWLPESKWQLSEQCGQSLLSAMEESAEDAAPPAQPAPQAAVTAQASLDKCTLGFVPLLAGQAPGCLDPCKPAVCDAVTNAINAYMAHKNVDDVKRSVCANRSPFECLLEPANIGSCRPLFTKAQQYGFWLPESKWQLSEQCR